MTDTRRALVLLGAVLACALVAARAEATPLRVVVPDPGNLQYMAFWIAQGAGYFRDEGVEVETIAPASPQGTEALVREGKASVFVLPPPVYIALIADKFPLYLVANLLQNDPINLVVRRSVFEQKKLVGSAPVDARLKAIAGLRVGVAPGPQTRLRALFTSYGLDADALVKVVVVRGPDQNDAFARGDLDALYAHTPYVERALLDQDARILVNQSRGDVPALALRQIHALAVAREFADRNRHTVTALVRAIARAEDLVHANAAAAVEAILRVYPSMDRAHVDAIVALYAPAIPSSPRVSADAIEPALALFPANKAAPDLSKVDRRDFVAPAFADSLTAPRRSRVKRLVPAAIAVSIALVAAALFSRRRKRVS